MFVFIYVGIQWNHFVKTVKLGAVDLQNRLVKTSTPEKHIFFHLIRKSFNIAYGVKKQNYHNRCDYINQGTFKVALTQVNASTNYYLKQLLKP